MKRFIIFLFSLLLFAGAYNFDVLRDSFYAARWDQSYNLGKMTDAWASYSRVDASGSLQSDTLYNLGNTFYRLWEKDETKRREFWQKSIDAYSGSLGLRKEQQTEENLEYVRKKLQALIETEEKKELPSEPVKTGEPTASGSTGDEPKTGESGAKASKDGKTWSNNGNYSSIWGEGSSGMESALTDQELQDLKKYTEQMTEFQKQNSRLLNPAKPSTKGGISEELRNFIGNDSLFENALNGNEGKKDW